MKLEFAILQFRLYLNQMDLGLEVHALVTPSLDYCNAHYMGIPLRMVQKLQLVQNVADLVDN